MTDEYLPVGMWRKGDRVVIIDPTLRHANLRACPACDGRIQYAKRRPANCDTCAGWGAVR